MSHKEVTVEEAAALLDAADGHVYVDVRSVPEFQEGHPAGALNVPVMHRQGPGLAPNADFLSVMESRFPRDARLLLGCLSGQRSAAAAGILEAAGYTDVSNVKGGFGGRRSPSGQSLDKGWAELGLPTGSGDPEGRSYASLAGGRDGAS